MQNNIFFQCSQYNSSINKKTPCSQRDEPNKSNTTNQNVYQKFIFKSFCSSLFLSFNLFYYKENMLSYTMHIIDVTTQQWININILCWFLTVIWLMSLFGQNINKEQKDTLLYVLSFILFQSSFTIRSCHAPLIICKILEFKTIDLWRSNCKTKWLSAEQNFNSMSWLFFYFLTPRKSYTKIHQCITLLYIL